MASKQRKPVVSPDVLNGTELRVTKLLSLGFSSADIAVQTGRSSDSVEQLIQQICRKVGVSDRPGLVRWAALYDVTRW